MNNEIRAWNKTESPGKCNAHYLNHLNLFKKDSQFNLISLIKKNFLVQKTLNNLQTDVCIISSIKNSTTSEPFNRKFTKNGFDILL